MNNMMNSMMGGGMGDKMMNRFFRKVDNVVWDLFTGKIGVQDDEGIVTLSGEGEDAQIELNLMDQFGMAVPAFAQNTPLDSVAVGDLIFQGNRIKGWVIKIVVTKTKMAATDADAATMAAAAAKAGNSVKRFMLMTPSGTTTTWTPPKVSMLGFDSGVMVLRSLMNMLPGGKSGLDNMQGMLMPMMMLGGDMDMDSIMPMMLMGQLGTSGDGSNAMGGNNMMQTMLMMQMMGNMGGGNKGGGGSMGGMFGNKKKTGHFDD